jgi:hypothetical protein
MISASESLTATRNAVSNPEQQPIGESASPKVVQKPGVEDMMPQGVNQAT